MSLLDRQIAFVEALRRAGLPVSLAEDLDAVRAVAELDLADRLAVRSAYAATLVKRHSHRVAFDTLFDLYFSPVRGGGRPQDVDQAHESGEAPAADEPALADLRDRLREQLETGEGSALRDLAREAVERFGPLRGRQPGQQSWSAYTVLSRVAPDDLVADLLQALAADGLDAEMRQRAVRQHGARFVALVESEVRRRVAETQGPDRVAETSVRPSLEQIDFLQARQADRDAMRREIYPLARRLATRLAREHHRGKGGSLDFRRTVRASVGTGGVPVVTHHRARRPKKVELVVLCDVSGSVAPFAQFTLGLVFALREQFARVRAFTFVDDVTEVTSVFRPGADLGETMAELAASARAAALWGRTSYGRAFDEFGRSFPHAIGPKTSLLVLGDARSNYGDLALPQYRRMVETARHAYWINPEHRRMWDTGDSAAGAYAEIAPMVECRNLAQLSDFVHDLV